MKNVMNHTPTIEQLFVDKTELEKVGYGINFVKIILKKNHNFDLALRKRRFCAAKQPLLPCKTYAFRMQNNRFYNALIIRWLCNRYAREKYLHFYCVFSVLILHCFLLVVIRFALDNAARTIELFYENKAHHLVGESHFRERNLFVGTVVHCF